MWANSVQMKATSMGPDITTIDAPLDNWALSSHKTAMTSLISHYTVSLWTHNCTKSRKMAQKQYVAALGGEICVVAVFVQCCVMACFSHASESGYQSQHHVDSSETHLFLFLCYTWHDPVSLSLHPPSFVDCIDCRHSRCPPRLHYWQPSVSLDCT